MFRIVEKQALNPSMTKMVVEAPYIARKALAGQFIILRVDEHGERIPLTVADYDREAGTVTIIYQKVGKTTKHLDTLNEGDCILDFIGPLGRASELEGYKKVAVIGGGAGCAIAFPQAKALHEMGTKVDVIAGFRNKELIILEGEMAAVSDELIVTTDDGSNGNQGFVTDALRAKIEGGAGYDFVDGTGMCGCCRLTVGGETKFACVDGPDFDGHLVDFDEAAKRLRTYKPEEEEASREEDCRLMRGVENA